MDCTRGYIRPLPFFLATPSLKRSRGQLEEEMSGIGGTATLAAMDRSFSILHWPPGSVGRNLSSESLERVSSVFPSFESAPRRWGSNPSSGITWRISFRSQALAQKACRFAMGLVSLGIGHDFRNSHQLQQESARFCDRINSKRTSRAQIWGTARLNFFSSIWEHHEPLLDEKAGADTPSVNGSGACDYRSPRKIQVIPSLHVSCQ